MRRLNLEVVNQGELEGLLSALKIQPSIFEEIIVKQSEDESLQKIRDRMTNGVETEFKIHEDGSLRFKERWCIPQKCKDIKIKIMKERHNTPYSAHPGGDKLYKDLKEFYWWPNMKREVAEFVSKFLTCQKVKIDHKRSMGKVQPLEIYQVGSGIPYPWTL
ncbi:uncharacterized protein LOC110724035 [Chenopodium quinoa]|uniref:uncharacterized protein LOC110724035 n=1 Tax=Chenopodium quinoa TaxID=63459 RepID=UPI000B780B5A|nr:uncharacterized protein LOC110724035 [Chenopodium quinoa]